MANPNPNPLSIIIVGAGIGGLSAAIALRQNGHTVSVLEKSPYIKDLGVAMHIPPNATGCLLTLGIDPSEHNAVKPSVLTQFTHNGEVMHREDIVAKSGMWQHPWYFMNRSSLHRALRKKAEDVGVNVVMDAEFNVTGVEGLHGESVTVKYGSGMKTGDLVIAADGIGSRLRGVVAPDAKLVPSGKSAYRFMVARSLVSKGLLREEGGEMWIWKGPDRSVVCYATEDNQSFNLVAIHPDSDDWSEKDRWGKPGDVQKLLSTFSGFTDDCLDILKLAEPQTLMIWRLLDMLPLDTWVKGRLALLGDAAHPFLPYQGQGASQALEDATSLAVVLPFGVKPDEVEERLKLYETCRLERAHRIQEYTRIAGQDHGQGVDMSKYTSYNFGHDEGQHSSGMLQKWMGKMEREVKSENPIGPILPCSSV